MALTQTATIVPGPSWDETIVPALKKRLQSESRTLSKRMSAASMEEQPMSLAQTAESISRITARPSLSHSQTTAKAFMQEPAQRLPQTTRSRTYSQPYAYEPATRQRNQQQQQETASRSTSPLYSSKPTRIPKARARAGSTSSYNQSSANGHAKNLSVTPKPEQNSHSTNDLLYSLHEPSRSTVAVPSRQTSGLLNEQPPFQPASISSAEDNGGPYGKYARSSNRPALEEPAPRASTESEERPFEHWYRGEVSRNGGVGEYRVGKRMEMLEIANYGHTIKANSRPPVIQETAMERKRRKRADSLNEKDRESIYLDEGNGQASQVLDEGPLTDMDIDTEDERTRTNYRAEPEEEEEEEDYTVGYTYEPEDEPPAELQTTSQEHRSLHSRSATPTRQNAPPSRIPGPSSRAAHVEPVVPIRSASEPPVFVPRQTSPSPSTPASQQKKRAKSPPVASASKRTRTRKEEELAARLKADNRRSVAYYPSPGDDEDMEYAIPSWTQPVPKSGNWDEVVLPVVARKKGLEGQYEKADGGPRPPPRSEAIEPAPGTFGYDHSKYRPPRNEYDESIPLSELGLVDESREIPREESEQQQEKENIRKGPPPNLNISTQNSIKPPMSPAPFAHYSSPKEATYNPPPQIKIIQPSLELKDDDNAGCCAKCVIM